MADSPYIVDVTMETAQAQIADASQQVPVLMDFWADWCGPCQSLIPILEKLAIEYDGKFILAKINADEQQQLAQHFEVRSLPTVKLLFQGQIVNEFMGAQTEEFVRNMLNELIDGSDAAPVESAPQNPEHLQALQYIQQGNDEKALELLFEIYQNDPDNQDAKLDMAELLLRSGRLDEVQNVLDAVSDDLKNSERVRSITYNIELSKRIVDLPDMETVQKVLDKDPKDKDALFAFANHLLMAKHYQTAMEALIRILTLDPDYMEGLAKATLLEAFDILGNEGELVTTYRRKLYSALN